MNTKTAGARFNGIPACHRHTQHDCRHDNSTQLGWLQNQPNSAEQITRQPHLQRAQQLRNDGAGVAARVHAQAPAPLRHKPLRRHVPAHRRRHHACAPRAGENRNTSLGRLASLDMRRCSEPTKAVPCLHPRMCQCTYSESAVWSSLSTRSLTLILQPPSALRAVCASIHVQPPVHAARALRVCKGCS